MSLKVKSEEDTLGFDHMKKPACEGRRKCARVSVTLSFGIRMWHAHSDTLRRPHATLRNPNPFTAGNGIESHCYLISLPSVTCY